MSLRLPRPRIRPHASPFRIELRRSRIHRYGVFALEPIAARRRVIEYTGQRISPAEVRRRYVTPQGKLRGKLTFLFLVNKHKTIDPSRGGSGAEFINHSCAPNLISCNIRGRVVLFSRRRISVGEELTFDYRFPKGEPKVKCQCGARNCRGTINRR